MAGRVRAGDRRVGPVVPRVRRRGARQVFVDAPAGACAGGPVLDASAGAGAPLRVPVLHAAVDGRSAPRRPGRRGDDGGGRVVGGRGGRVEVEERPGVRARPALLVGHGQSGGPGQGAGASDRRRAPVRRGADAGRGRARVAAYAPRQPVRDRGRGPDPEKRRAARQASGRGRGQEREGVRRLARRAAGIVPGERAGRGDGRVRRVQEGRRPPGAPRGRGPRPVPHGPARRPEGHQGQMPAPAGGHRTAGHQTRSALPVPQNPAEDRIAAHRQAEGKRPTSSCRTRPTARCASRTAPTRRSSPATRTPTKGRDAA